ncbi:hypothetical protein [Corynebacterium macclintockiae]|uniref:hypothetical protein n=1 Tax=Corynebacterium macclintockiae TaxID=2913501 RepID=UPI003EBFFD36
MDELQNWVAEATNGASWRSIAERLGTTHVTIQRRLRNDTASAVLELAREYNANPITGLLAASGITNQDLNGYSREVSIREFSDLELAQEIVRRLEEREQEGGNGGDLADVYEFQAVADSSPDEDALRAQQEGNDLE